MAAAISARAGAINVEYCSTNPTGPLHVGHGRGTVFGDALANLLAQAGYAVTREYYVNDGGAQIEALARSLHLRYREALGEAVGAIPQGLYPGDYLVPVAQAIAATRRRSLAGRSRGGLARAVRARAASTPMMALIRDDLAALGVRHDVFTSERGLIEDGRIDEALRAARAARACSIAGTLPPPKGKPVEDWEPVDAAPVPLDRVRRRHRPAAEALDRGLDLLRRRPRLPPRQVPARLPADGRRLGADHGGYVKRMQAAVRALSRRPGVDSRSGSASSSTCSTPASR